MLKLLPEREDGVRLKLAGLKEVPVVIKDYSPQEIMEVALIENIQREDLNPVEEAKAYQNLIKEYNLKQEEVAERVSKSRSAITNSLASVKIRMMCIDMLINGRRNFKRTCKSTAWSGR
ncbi:MAG: ParB/RepB/Spo0J family partition protein [Eubacterium sp.]